jgi:hypothetical protein
MLGAGRFNHVGPNKVPIDKIPRQFPEISASETSPLRLDMPPQSLSDLQPLLQFINIEPGKAILHHQSPRIAAATLFQLETAAVRWHRKMASGCDGKGYGGWAVQPSTA